MVRRVRRDVRVEGVVQGVGFRPFVYSLATKFGLAGQVGNDVDGVFIEVEGAAADVEDFLLALERDAPPLAEIEKLTVVEADPNGFVGFEIAPSECRGQPNTLVTADSATCADCLRELFDPLDRRFQFPFINCTNCGPRFTIVRSVPYDRSRTTMAEFPLCQDCAVEYHDPTNRRFHAQPVCCWTCGPRLRLVDEHGRKQTDDPVKRAAELLANGRVLAVKGLGGYHLAVAADCEPAAAALRQRKHREDKPFAVMVPDLADAKRLCEVDAAAELLLTGRRRPIVLMPRRADATVARSVAPGQHRLGVLLPYTPLHHLLLRTVGRPIVLTSGNVSDEPIAYADAEALDRLAHIADAFLTHDRAIHVRTDDSVVRTFGGRACVVRRSRGYAPEPIALQRGCPRPVLACGAELKNTFCLAKGGRAFLSQHIGDLENYETLRSFADAIGHLQRLFDITPEVIAHDLHPEYLSTKYALDLDGVELVGVQHHHAHIASCLTDNGEVGPVIGVAFDGLGYGLDATLWGGEFLLADLVGFERLGHFAPVPMPGAAAAIQQPWRMAAAYLDIAYHGEPPGGLDVVRRHAAQWADVVAVARRRVNSPLTSSVGRLFDAVAAVLGVRDEITYEGQAAIELEQGTDPLERRAYQVGMTGRRSLVLAGADLLRAVVEDVTAGVDPAVISARFHNGLADVVTRCCRVLRDWTGLGTVALSGGVFQNLLLLQRCVDGLSASGFRVLTHSRVPTNDGGVSLGQAAVAAAIDRSRR